MQLVALGCSMIGFIVIVINKVNHGAAHFTSLHGKLGLTTFVLAMIQGMLCQRRRSPYHRIETELAIGIFGISRRFWLWYALGLHYQRVIAIHRIFGYATIFCALATMFTAMDNKWTEDNWSPSELRLAVKACVTVVGIIVFVLAQWRRVLVLLFHKEPTIT